LAHDISKQEAFMCPHCADGSDRELARRARVLQPLALVEHPTALPAEATLRIGRTLLAWAEHDDSRCECDPSVAPVTRIVAAA
jgi:hypothetical protein